MKKTLIALAVLGSIAGVAQAQSSVTIYGKLDQGVRKVTGEDVQLTQRSSSRLGFKGAEDLGNGMSAIFQFENRFLADTGASKTPLFQAQSNVGLKGNFGTVRLGRIYNPVDDISAAMDPFGQDGIGAMQLSKLTVTRQDNSLRYDSPSLSGFGVHAIYSVKEAKVGDVRTAPVLDEITGAVTTLGTLYTASQLNDGYGVAATYNNGPITAGAGYNRITNSSDSDYWNIGGGYTFGPAKVTAVYEDLNNKTSGTEVSEKNALIGLAYNIGAGTINASYGQLKIADATNKKLAAGYTHNLSKRTSLYGNVARTNLDVPKNGEDNINAVEVGVTHLF